MLLLSIVIHNYPVSIALLGMLLHSGMQRNRALLYLATFAAMAPLGVLLSSHTQLASYSRHLTALAVGIFMHISTSILFESSDLHRFNRNKTIAILLGTALGLVLVAVD
jgi:zinc transporter ZupT